MVSIEIKARCRDLFRIRKTLKKTLSTVVK
jgi:hypothetical protein